MAISGTLNSNIVIKATSASPNTQTINIVPRWEGGNYNDITKTFISIGTVMAIRFTWHLFSDERGRLYNGTTSLTNDWRSCYIEDVNKASNGMKYLVYSRRIVNDTTCYVKCTKGKQYTFHTRSDNYKSRDYGFVISQSPAIEAMAGSAWTTDY